MKITKLYKSMIFMLLFVFVAITACNEDILDQSNPNALAPSNFWRNAEDAKKGIMGAYAPFTDIWYYTRFEIFLSDYRDDVVNGFNTSERTAAGNFNASPDSNGAKWVWSAMFKGISRANEVLGRVPAVEMNETEKKNILGEAYFIRAFNYFNLLNTWLNVPLLTVPSGQVPDTRNVPQATPEETRTQIIADLKEAQNNLPDSWSEVDKGRVTKMGATALLGKVYLYAGDWTNAKAEFQKVMNSSHGLVDDYRDNFREATENNKESLFEIQMIADGISGWCADCGNHGAGAAFHQDLAPQGFTGQDGMRINDWVLDLFLDEKTVNDEIDPRAFVTLFWDTNETTTYEGDQVGSRTYLGATYQETYNGGDTRIYASKHLDFESGRKAANDGGWHQFGNNLRILRYADVLLMFAEAEFNLNGSTGAALAAINEVRERVDMPAFTSITLQDIKDERVKELSLERTRFYDLLRWGQVKERIVDTPGIKSESGGTGSYVPGREYVAIPTDEMNNSDVFVQNTGWVSQ